MSLDPMPALFVIIDEFSELLSQTPEFVSVLTAIGRLGRSVGIHLLLASQRLDEVSLRSLDAHLSYRIALKTYSLNESRAVLDAPLAYHLPSIPGSGYLRTHPSGELVRFVAAYSSRAEPAEPSSGVIEMADLPLRMSIVHAMAGVDGRRAHQIWLPPLDVSPTVGGLAPPLPAPLPVALQRMPGLRPAAIGIVDTPRLHTRTLLQLDLTGAQGNVAVVGGPQCGKSNTLRTLILALAVTHTPDQVQFYCLDFGGGELAALSGLPHVGSVAGRHDVDRVRRTVAELTALIQRREELFAQLDMSMEEFRGRKAQLVDSSSKGRAADPLGGDRFGDAFLVIDGYEAVRQDYESIEQTIAEIAARGLAFGVHVVLAASRWTAFRPALRDYLGSCVELRLGDPADSILGRRQALSVPIGSPGRGLTPDGLHMLIALPRLDTRTDPAGMAEGIAAAIRDIGAHSGDLRAPEVRMLPEQVTREQLLLRVGDTPGQSDPSVACLNIPIGFDESELAPVFIDFSVSSHMLVFGDVESGKTNLLRLLVRGICGSNTPDQARIVLADPRRTLLAEVPPEYLAGYAWGGPNLVTLMKGLVESVGKRLPADSVTPQQLRDRSWWTGPELYLLVDDYDLLASSENPIGMVRELLPHGRDIGFHLIVTRRTGGASRALYEPVIAMLRELGSTGLIMSGSRDEGALLASIRPEPMPPGRGMLVDRRRVELVQTAWVPPPV
nr:type VII secretion protein EccCb [Nocardia vaccinii]